MNRLLLKPVLILALRALGTMSILLTLTACTGLFNGNLFKERAAETPPPDEQAVDKSFFENRPGHAKSFLCAWAPEIGQGWAGEAFLTPFTNEAMHCNVEFDITKDALVARVIDPTFPNGGDPVHRQRWKQIIEIPITKHYYLERNKDAHGRETHEWIENEARSDWRARPKMKLDLSRVKIMGYSDASGLGQEHISSAQDIEWDLAANFLGFSVNMTFNNPHAGGAGELQGRFRFNFLKFEHDPTFKKVPYHQENSKFLNILHVMGRRIEGVEPELYAAHWDLRQPTKIYISGAPKDQEVAVMSSIQKWNDELKRIGATQIDAFQPIVKNLKHPFDLRYPSVTWIDDMRISLHAPLGIGMAHADVRNGKILWGGVVLFGGMLQKFINSYAPIDPNGPTGESSLSPFQSLASLFPANLKSMNRARLEQTGDRPRGLHQQSAKQVNDPALTEVFQALHQAVADDSEAVKDYFARMPFPTLLGSSVKPHSPLKLTDVAARTGHRHLINAFKEERLDKRREILQGATHKTSPFFIEQEMTIANKVGSWMSSPGQTKRSYTDNLASVVQNLMVHEFGHFLGLGHQFKENIVPLAGQVPSRFVKELTAKATQEKEFTNYTSIMGYQSGRTEIMTPADDYKPGPHDTLVLHYLYKSEYSVLDPKKDEFKFLPIPVSGKIPLVTRVGDSAGDSAELRTSYFPHCNDFEATLGGDPFCNRWDRGSSAVDIVNSYFESINDNLLANLFSLVGGGSHAEAREAQLWSLSLRNFSRVRLFYDEMRRRLRSDPQFRPLWDQLRNDKDALLEFSKACAESDPTSDLQVRSATLREIFKDSSMVDLCRANAVAIKEFGFFLSLHDADYTRIDHNNRYVQGGYLAGDTVQSYGNMFGSWYQLSNLPLKFSSLYTLTGANSYLLWHGYLVPNPYYDSEENRYLYRTLYPVEFTRLISNTVQSNLRFAVSGKDDTTRLGKAVLATGALLPWQGYTSNDAARLPREFNDLLDQQTHFKFSMVAIIIEPAPPDSTSNVKADHFKKFKGSVYDQFTDKSADTRDLFILPNGDVFVRANGMFLFPTSKIKFFKGNHAYVVAYKVDYDEGPRDDLVQESLKRALMEKYIEISDTCIKGFNSNGLVNYFSDANKEFEGFHIPNGIAEESNPEKLGVFYDSIKKEFDKYETTVKIPSASPLKSMRRICDESMRGIGQISAAAAMANGIWLSITKDYVEK